MDPNALAIANAWSGVGKNMFQGQANFERGKMDAASRMAQQFAAESAGRLNQEKALDLQQRRAFQTPEFGTKIAAAMVGLPDGAGSDLEQFQQRGNWGMNPEQPLPMDQAGPPRPESPKAAPNWYQPGIEQKFNMARGAQMLGLGGTGNSDANNMAEAYGKLLGQGRIDNAIANPVQAANFARAMAASKGDALFNQGSNGVMEKFTGQETLNAVGNSAAAENKAQATSAYANADQSRASAALSRSKIGQGQTVTAPDGTVITTGKPTKLSSAAEKELFEADDTIQAGKNVIDTLRQALKINDTAYSGYAAKGRAILRSNLPGESDAANATINLDNMMTGQALESLKVIFGGMPTEGERKILLEMQASADKTPSQRRGIIERGIKAAEKRVIFNTNKAKSLRSGTYNGSDPQQQAAADATIASEAPKQYTRTGTLNGRKVGVLPGGQTVYQDTGEAVE